MNGVPVHFDEGSPAGGPAELELLMAYEDIATGERVKCAVDRALGRSEANVVVRYSLYNLSELGNPWVQKKAARQAQQADILVVSLHGRTPISSATGDSLKQWFGLKRCKPCATVISLDSDERETATSNPLLAELCSTAAGNGMTVLMQFAEPPGVEMESAIAEIRRRADTPFHLFDEPVRGGVPQQNRGLHE